LSALNYSENTKMKIRSHKELDVYQMAFEAAMKIYELSKKFPSEEKYSLTDQIRRSSRSVCSNLSEGFRKRKYPKSFVAKLSDSEGEAAETQTWLDFSLACAYITAEVHSELYDIYDRIIGKLVNMSLQPEKWSY
jgi:four helix bundle protein